MLPEKLSLVITRPPTWTEKRLAMANKMVKHLCEWLQDFGGSSEFRMHLARSPKPPAVVVKEQRLLLRRWLRISFWLVARRQAVR